MSEANIFVGDGSQVVLCWKQRTNTALVKWLMPNEMEALRKGDRMVSLLGGNYWLLPVGAEHWRRVCTANGKIQLSPYPLP